jgi:hypothetical protein
MENFNGKVAVITGAGRGIGMVITLGCGKEAISGYYEGGDFETTKGNRRR